MSTEQKNGAMIVCRRCHAEKATTAFGSNKSRHNGLDVWCRICRSAYSRQRYAAKSPYGPRCGLTKRELFAAMAMQGMLGNSNMFDVCDMGPNGYAQDAVLYADALLAALEADNG